MSGAAAPRRLRARVEGVVQGVGFRPFVYKLATELELGGWVRNDSRGVLLEVEGSPEALERFLERLAGEAPPLAAVESIRTEDADPDGERGFAIAESDPGGEPEALVSPDTATCVDCLGEVFDPGDRRHRYPFTNCTNCGPRFTIVRGVPYDRPLTTMAGFEMCEACRAEYEDPLDRRFHAQPNACPACGPELRLHDPDGEEASGDAALLATGAALREGRIAAVKGLGGFHLACLASDDDAVAALRSRKHREDKPFALMAPTMDAARELVDLDAEAERLLASRERPIVIAPRRDGADVAGSVAPRSRELGVMLPYTPLHHLLLADLGAPLVMTSANVSDEPIAYEDWDALERLAKVADLFLLHDRPIHIRTDDSVARSVSPAGHEQRSILLRRARGYVPESLALPIESPAGILGCGAELKSVFCLAKGARAWVGHHIGDLKNYETLVSFSEGIAHFERLFAVEPEIVAHDLHPQYLSTRYALEREGVPHVGVQHHHAHLAACLAEHGEAGPAIGAIYDGTGYGPDGTVWGGELLAGGLAGYERAGMLWPAPLPGGDAAVREPWRMACSWLAVATDEAVPPLPEALQADVSGEQWRQVSELVATGLNSPITTSAGRLFDAVAALCGIGARVNYEGQAASELEAAADPGERSAYELPLLETGDALLLDARELVRAVAADAAGGVPVGVISARFHNGLAAATAAACAREAERRGLDLVVLSGGVFQNRLLLELTARAVTGEGLRVLMPQRLPPNDGGISYGQAAVAAATAS